MSRAVSPSTGRLYGVLRVTRLWGVSRATVYRHRRRGDRARPAGAARRPAGR
jgi:putative transposase